MIVPDLQQICEIMLFSEGFEGAKVLAKNDRSLLVVEGAAVEGVPL